MRMEWVQNGENDKSLERMKGKGNTHQDLHLNECIIELLLRTLECDNSLNEEREILSLLWAYTEIGEQ